jgi:hypothetical protein
MSMAKNLEQIASTYYDNTSGGVFKRGIVFG